MNIGTTLWVENRGTVLKVIFDLFNNIQTIKDGLWYILFDIFSKNFEKDDIEINKLLGTLTNILKSILKLLIDIEITLNLDFK